MEKVRWSLLEACRGHGHEDCLRAWQPKIMEWLDEQVEINHGTVLTILNAIQAVVEDEERRSEFTDCPGSDDWMIHEDPEPLIFRTYDWEPSKDLIKEIAEKLNERGFEE